MKILGVFIQNYASFHGRHFINLADLGLVSVLGENQDDPRAKSNGAGKSSWSDALDWCLWGEHPRGDTAQSVVNDEAREKCCVTVDVVGDDGSVLRIMRIRDWPGQPNGPKLFVNGKEETALDAKETQLRISAAMGLDLEVFHAAVLFGQGDTFSFADATDAQRKDILVRILPELAEVDVLQERAANAAQDAAVDLAQADNEEAQLASRQQALRDFDPTPRVAQWEEWRNAQVQRLESEYARQVYELNSRTQQQASPIPAPVQLPPQPGMHRVRPPMEVDFQNADAECNGLRALAVEAKDLLQRLLSKKDGPCAACGQLVTAGHLEAERTAAKAKFDALVAQGVAKAANRDALRAQVQEWLRAQQQAQDAEQHAWKQAYEQASQHNAAVASAQKQQHQVLQELARAKAVVDGLAAEISKHRALLNPEIAGVDAWRVQMVDLDTRLFQTQQRKLELQRRHASLEFWKVGLGAKGLKSYVLDARVGEMADEANRWIQLLTGGTVWVQFATQREVGKGKGKKFVEDLTIKIFRSNPDGTITERGYRSWSGGEKYRIALGIDFGLARLVAKRAKRSYDLLILDEVFQHSLDSTGKEAVAEMLQVLAKEKSTIMVIDHDASFQNMFDARMIVRKKNRRSRVVDGVFYDEAEPQDSKRAGQAEHVLARHPAFPG